MASVHAEKPNLSFFNPFSLDIMAVYFYQDLTSIGIGP